MGKAVDHNSTGYHAPASHPSDDGAADFTERYLESLRVRHSATGNPLYFWWAIDWCLNEEPRHPLPDWCEASLADLARRVTGLGNIGATTSGSKKTLQNPARSQLLHALGFTSKGWNAFKSAGSQLLRIKAAIQLAVLRSHGTPSGKALGIVMDCLGVNDESNAKAMIRDGQRILRGKTSG
jgi:hypothetical protein